MAEPAVATKVRDSSIWPTVKKRWRAWLRAVHRDVGYLAIGFTVIYAVSGIAQNHIEDWGEVSYRNYEKTVQIAAIADDVPDEVAVQRVATAAGLGKPTGSYRAGDEVRLEYASGAKVTAIGTEVTIQGRERRAFIGWANWLHTARNKSGWKYVADAYAVLLLYLAISGIFMIKGRLGLRWRGALLISAGIAVPVAAVLVSGPGAKTPAPAAETASPSLPAPTPMPTRAPAPESAPDVGAAPAVESAPATAPESASTPSNDESGIKFLPPESP